MKSHQSKKHQLSKVYRTLSVTDPAKIQWEQKLDITVWSWEAINLSGHKLFSNVSFWEKVFTVLSRWYYTPERWSTIFLSISNICWRRFESNATLLRILEVDSLWNKKNKEMLFPFVTLSYIIISFQ